MATAAAPSLYRRGSSMKPIAIYHEHPDWFRPLFAELDRRQLPYVRLDASAHNRIRGVMAQAMSLS